MAGHPAPPSTASSSSGSKDPGALPKPYTEYTIFFRLERARLLQAQGIIDEEIVASLDPHHADPLECPRPPGYATVTMPPYWYSSSHKAAVEKRRKHRKREGRMDLKTMSKTISASWRNAPLEVVAYCRKLARAELEKYNVAIERQIDERAMYPSIAEGQGNGNKAQHPPRRASFTNVPDGTLSLQDFVVQGKQQQQQQQYMPMNATSNNMMGNNLHKIMHMNHNMNQGQAPTNETLMLLQLQQQLQAAHQGSAANNCHGDVSPNSVVRIPLPKGNFARRPSASGVASSLLPDQSPTQDKKRKHFVRRATAPAKPTESELQNLRDCLTGVPYMGPTSCGLTADNELSSSLHSVSSCATMPNNGYVDANLFLCEDVTSQQPPAKMNLGQRMRRRASMNDMSGQAEQLQAVRRQFHPRGTHRVSMSSIEEGGLTSSFQAELRQEYGRGFSTGSNTSDGSNHGHWTEQVEALKSNSPQTHKRVSMSSIDEHTGNLSSSFQQELRQEFARGTEFSCVPSNWGSDDACTLLDILGGGGEATPAAAADENNLDQGLDLDSSVGLGMRDLLGEGPGSADSTRIGNGMFS